MKRKISNILICFMVLVTMIGGMGAVSAQITTEAAELDIQQQAYVQSDVQFQSGDDKNTYRVSGESVNIRPSNFNESEVINFGVKEGNATIRYSPEFDMYVLDANGNSGTYTLYWNVERQIGNNSTSTTQYVADVQFANQVDMTHVQSGSLSEMRDDAAKWDDFAQEVRNIGGEDVNMEQAVTAMLNMYQFTQDPLSALTGNYTQIIIITGTTVGGLVFLLQISGYHVIVLSKLRKETNVHNATEAKEGETRERLEQIDDKERKKVLANLDWFDIFEDDHLARAFRDHMGETVLDGWMNFNSLILPENIMKDRIRAMSECGYVGIEVNGENGDVEIIEEGDVEEDDEVVDLAEVDIDRIDWSSPEIAEFDLTNENFEPGENFDIEYEAMNVDELVEKLGPQMRHFDNEEEYAKYVREFVESVRDHEMSDENGSPDTMRYTFNAFLKTAQLLEDRYNFPLASYQTEAFERAIQSYDIGASAEEYLKEVKQGKHAS